MAFKEFILLLAKALGITFVIGSLTIIVGRAIWIKWNKTGKFFMKYKIFRSKVDPVRAEWIIEALNKGLNADKVKIKLLLAGFKNEDVNEMIYLAKQMQLKGGNNKDGRQFERSDSKDESRKLPNHSGISTY